MKPVLSVLDSRLTAGGERWNDDDDDDDDLDSQRRIVRFFCFSGEGAAIGEVGMDTTLEDSSPSAVRCLMAPCVVGEAAGLTGENMVASERIAGENIV